MSHQQGYTGRSKSGYKKKKKRKNTFLECILSTYLMDRLHILEISDRGRSRSPDTIYHAHHWKDGLSPCQVS